MAAVSSFLARGRAGWVGRLARPGESVVRRLRGAAGFPLVADAAFFGAWLDRFDCFLAVFFVAFAAAFGGVDAALRGALLARFLVVFLAAFAVDFFAAFLGGFVDARFAGGFFVVFLVAIKTPEAGTLSESRILATVEVVQHSTT